MVDLLKVSEGLDAADKLDSEFGSVAVKRLYLLDGVSSAHISELGVILKLVSEDVCREQMWKMNADEVWPFIFSKIGRYWDSNTEIDVIALDPDGKNLIAGECKYWKEPVGINILMELEEKTKKITWNQSTRKNWYILFSPSGFTPELKEFVKIRTDVILSEYH